MKVKLSEAAKIMSYHRMTVWHHIKSGRLPATQNKAGTWYVDTKDIDAFMGIGEQQEPEKGVVIYARVSCSQNRKNLDTQAERLEKFCLAKGWKVAKIVKEIGSGMNDTRTKFLEVIKNHSSYDHIVVEHKDRLTRFGFNIVTSFVDNIYVVNETEDKKENLVEDLVSIITSYCSRIYGQRKSKRKTEKLIAELNNAD